MKNKKIKNQIEKKLTDKFYDKFIHNTKCVSLTEFNRQFCNNSFVDQEVEFFNDNKNLIRKFISSKTYNKSIYFSSYITDWNRKLVKLKYFLSNKNSIIKECNCLSQVEKYFERNKKEFFFSAEKILSIRQCVVSLILRVYLLRISNFNLNLQDFILKHGADYLKCNIIPSSPDLENDYLCNKGKRFWGFQLEKATTEKLREKCYLFVSKQKLISFLRKKEKISDTTRWYLLNHKLLSNLEIDAIKNKNKIEVNEKSNAMTKIENIMDVFESNNYSWRDYYKLESLITSSKDINPCYLLGITSRLRNISHSNSNYNAHLIERIGETINRTLHYSKINL